MSITEVTRQEISLHLCPPCLMDMCETCFGGTCRCACVDSWRVTPAEPPAPERCRKCGYLVGASGHAIACGLPGHDAERAAGRERLAAAAAEYYGGHL